MAPLFPPATYFFSLPERENVIRAPARPQSLSLSLSKTPPAQLAFSVSLPSPTFFLANAFAAFSFPARPEKETVQKRTATLIQSFRPRQCMERKGPLLFLASHLSSTLCAESKATEHKYPCEEVRQTSFFLNCTVTQVTESQLEMQISKSIQLKLF